MDGRHAAEAGAFSRRRRNLILSSRNTGHNPAPSCCATDGLLSVRPQVGYAQDQDIGIPATIAALMASAFSERRPIFSSLFGDPPD